MKMFTIQIKFLSAGNIPTYIQNLEWENVSGYPVKNLQIGAPIMDSIDFDLYEGSSFCACWYNVLRRGLYRLQLIACLL